MLAKGQVMTYKWLSVLLAVPCDLAKQMLFEFKRQKKNAVYATYVVGGRERHSGTLKFELLREENLESERLEFAEIICQHIYSVGPKKISNLESIFAEENLKFLDFLQTPNEPLTLAYLTNKNSPISNLEIRRNLSGAFRPAYLSPKKSTPETKWNDSFQKLEISESMAAVKRKIGFVTEEKKKSATATASTLPRDQVAKKNKIAGKKNASGTKFVLPEVLEDDAPAVPEAPEVPAAPKGSLAAFLAGGGKKDSGASPVPAPEPISAKKPFFGAVKGKKPAAPEVPAVSEATPEVPEKGKRLKKRNSAKWEEKKNEEKMGENSDDIFVDSSSSDEEEKKMEEEEEEEEEVKPKKKKVIVVFLTWLRCNSQKKIFVFF